MTSDELQFRMIQDLRKLLFAAADEIERLRVDAERYRWLRENVNSSRAAWNQHCGGFDVLLTTEELDLAIDAAMENHL